MRIAGALLVPGLMGKCWQGDHDDCPGVHLVKNPTPAQRCGCGCHVEPWPFEHES